MKLQLSYLILFGISFTLQAQELDCNNYSNQMDIDQKILLTNECDFDNNQKYQNYSEIFHELNKSEIKKQFQEFSTDELNKIARLIYINADKIVLNQKDKDVLINQTIKNSKFYNAKGLKPQLNLLNGLTSNYSFKINSIEKDKINVTYSYSNYKKDDVSKYIFL